MKIEVKQRFTLPDGTAVDPGQRVDVDAPLGKVYIKMGLAAKVEKPPARKPPKPAPAVRDISEVVGEQRQKLFEGSRRSIDSLLGKAIVIERFAVMESVRI